MKNQLTALALSVITFASLAACGSGSETAPPANPFSIVEAPSAEDLIVPAMEPVVQQPAIISQPEPTPLPTVTVVQPIVEMVIPLMNDPVDLPEPLAVTEEVTSDVAVADLLADILYNCFIQGGRGYQTLLLDGWGNYKSTVYAEFQAPLESEGVYTLADSQISFDYGANYNIGDDLNLTQVGYEQSVCIKPST